MLLLNGRGLVNKHFCVCLKIGKHFENDHNPTRLNMFSVLCENVFGKPSRPQFSDKKMGGYHGYRLCDLVQT